MGSLVDGLSVIVGRSNVLTGDDVAPYSWDALGPSRGFAAGVEPFPLCVVRPASAEEVALIVRVAAENLAPIVPFGGGSGLMGGAVAVQPSIVLDTTRMDAVVGISSGDHAVRVQAGAVLGRVNEALAEHGLMLGHDPWTVNVATVGGTISTDSLGYLGAKYGSMGDQVLGLTAVLANGSTVSTSAAAKSSVGPDLRRLFIGGEGCFGVITDATLRAFPIPEAERFLAMEFETFEAGFNALLAMRNASVAPSVMDYGEDYIDGAPETSRLYLGFHGFREEVFAHAGRAASIGIAEGARGVGQEAALEYWRARHDIGDRFGARRRSGTTPRPADDGGFDYAHVSLPASSVPAFRERCLAIARKHGVRPVELGLWCTPELFSVVVASSGDGWRERLSGTIDAMLTEAREAGGSIEYCHGVGLRLAHLMEAEHGNGLDMLRTIKDAIDPLGLMNPGKLGL